MLALNYYECCDGLRTLSYYLHLSQLLETNHTPIHLARSYTTQGQNLTSFLCTSYLVPIAQAPLSYRLDGVVLEPDILYYRGLCGTLKAYTLSS